MADATVKAWKCDICGRVYKDGMAGSAVNYALSLRLTSGQDFAGFEVKAPQICYDCAGRIATTVWDLEDEGDA